MLASMSAALTTLALAATAPQGLVWESDYGKALAQTQSDDRPLLIVLDNPGAEKQELDPAVLGNADEKLMAAYDLCRVNVSTAYGKKVADAFHAKEFPYLAIIDKTGKVVLHSRTGEITAVQLESTLTKYKSGVRPVRVTVAKPVTIESSTTINSSPVYQSSPSYYNPPADCPNCRRGY